MLPLRRVALRALSARPSTSTLLFNSSRTFVTCKPQTYRSQQRWVLSGLQRRFASDEAKPSESTETATEAPSDAEQRAAAEVAAESSAPVVSSQDYVPEPVAAETVVSSRGGFHSKPDSYAGRGGSTTGAARFSNSSFGQSELDIPENNVLYIGNLFFESTEADLKQHFESFGAVESVKVIYDHRGLSKGFGYITYASVADATRAIQASNQEVFQGRRITVQYHRARPARKDYTKPRAPNAPSKTLFIGNMSFEMSDKDLNDLFREIHNVLDVRVAIDRRSGAPRGFAHADFIDVTSATKAKDLLQDKEVYGRRLRVDYSISSPER